jgi:hypothetical protein
MKLNGPININCNQDLPLWQEFIAQLQYFFLDHNYQHQLCDQLELLTQTRLLLGSDPAWALSDTKLNSKDLWLAR